MPRSLAPNIWFVRSNGGSGSYPVTPEGWRVVRRFAFGVAASAVIAAIAAAWAPTWLWVVLFAAGMAGSAWYFIDTARRHTDYSVTYDEWSRG